MSLHRSLKTQPGALNRHRNVLSRHERITTLMEREQFDPAQDSPLGLVKVASRKIAKVKKEKKEVAKQEETTEDSSESS